MEKFYFIIRAGEWCSGFYHGTIEELKSALGKIGAEIIGEEECDFERIGLIFDKRLTTRMSVYGRDRKTYNAIMDEIVDVFKKHGMKASRRNLEDIYDLRSAATQNIVFDTNKLDVLVSDGVFHPKPNCGYVGVYSSYKPFSEFNEGWIWDTLGSQCGYSAPSLA